MLSVLTLLGIAFDSSFRDVVSRIPPAQVSERRPGSGDSRRTRNTLLATRGDDDTIVLLPAHVRRKRLGYVQDSLEIRPEHSRPCSLQLRKRDFGRERRRRSGQSSIVHEDMHLLSAPIRTSAAAQVKWIVQSPGRVTYLSEVI